MLLERSFGSVKILSIDYNRLLASLKEAASRIREAEPGVRRVLLFGSFARGDYTPLSDVDILIEVNHSGEPFLERRDRFVGYFTIPFDLNILVYTSCEIRDMTVSQNDFLSTVLAGSVTLLKM